MLNDLINTISLPQEFIAFTNAALEAGNVANVSGTSVIECQIDMGDGIAQATVTVTNSTFSINVAFNGEYINVDMITSDGEWVVDGQLTLSGVNYDPSELWRAQEEVEQLLSEMVVQ